MFTRTYELLSLADFFFINISRKYALPFFTINFLTEIMAKYSNVFIKIFLFLAIDYFYVNAAPHPKVLK